MCNCRGIAWTTCRCVEKKEELCAAAFAALSCDMWRIVSFLHKEYILPYIWPFANKSQDWDLVSFCSHLCSLDLHQKQQSSSHQSQTHTHTLALLQIHFHSIGILADPHLASHAISSHMQLINKLWATCSLAAQYFLFALTLQKALAKTIACILDGLTVIKHQITCIAAADSSNN